MGYNYLVERPKLFTEDGQLLFIKIRDNAQRLIKLAGIAYSGNIVAGCSGDSWLLLACLDRLVEIKELYEIPNGLSRAGQHRIFTIIN